MIDKNLNHAWHSITKYSPNELLTKESILNPLKWQLHLNNEEIKRGNKRAAEKNQRDSNKYMKEGVLKPNNRVLVKNFYASKVDPRMNGPFRCLKVSSTGARAYIEEDGRTCWHNIKNLVLFRNKKGQDVTCSSN